jgi:Na+/H+ antiporter NhaA
VNGQLGFDGQALVEAAEQGAAAGEVNAVFVDIGRQLGRTDFQRFERGLCFFYLGFLLFLPLATPIVVQLLLGFALGLTMDIFYDTGGVHAAAAVLLAYLRPWVLRLLTPRDGYDAQDAVNIHQMGWQWFGVYLGLLVLLHHVAFFILELGSFRNPGLTLVKVGLSWLFSCLALLIVQLLFFPVRRGRG